VTPRGSCPDLQSIEPSTVAARLASRLHLRPWRNAGPWRVPAGGRSDRVMVGGAPLVVLNLPSGTGSPAPARPQSDRRGSVARRASFHEVRRPFSAPTLESSLPGTGSESAHTVGTVAQPVCRPKATPRRQEAPDGASRRPLPDDRRVGCRDGRWSVPGAPVRQGTAGVQRTRSWHPSRPALDRGPRRSVVEAGSPRPSHLRGAGLGCTSRWIVVPRREVPSSLRSACAVSHDLGGLPLSRAVRHVSSGHARGVWYRSESPAGGTVVGWPEGQSFRGGSRGRIRVAGMRSPRWPASIPSLANQGCGSGSPAGAHPPGARPFAKRFRA
jgi:hypothetical protein